MGDYSSGSDDSQVGEYNSESAVVRCLESFKLQTCEFSQPNLAKPFAACEVLTAEQTNILESLEILSDSLTLSHKRFISIARETSDIRSFRALLGQQVSNSYDFSLMCLDIYFHQFFNPSIFLRTGFPNSRLSIHFQENGLLRPNVVCLDIDPYENYLSLFFDDLQMILFSYDLNWTILPQYLEIPVPGYEGLNLANLLKFACPKYGILEHLQKPMPEFASAISAYFILYKPNLTMQIGINSAEEGESEVKFAQNSWAYQNNVELMQEFEEKGYNSMVTQVHNEILALLEGLPSSKEKFGIDIALSTPVVLNEASQNDPQPPESSTDYFQALKDYRFNTADFFSTKQHILLENLSEEGPINTNRLSKEIRVLSQHLPCETHGAIFVVMDSERMDLLKALISGTEDTPYAHGLFEFHIRCPQEYPKKPPLVSIVTTGKGKVRFNPNLYDDGYVCLSVINTWDGDPSERWNPAHSNILQVLLSIQVLVMDNRIIQKEPEFDHLAEDSSENKMYSNIVKYNNVKFAMLGMLQNPPPEFKDVIFRHFALKRNAIMATVDKWLDEAKNFVTPNDGDIDYLVMDHNPHTSTLFKSYSYYSMLLEARNELLVKLNSLDSVGVPLDDYQVIEITEDLAKLGGYYKKMSSFILVDKDMGEAGGYRHSLACHLPKFQKYQTGLDRFTSEKVSLAELKCAPNSSIFIVRDTDRWDLMKILISGPIGSDYNNGLFLFDIVCPEDFPQSPPKVLLITTGRFTVNFHPRLRSNGEVLGLTWTSESTLSEFFLQIQNIFKENESESSTLKTITRYNTLAFAILDMLKHPPIEFKSAITAHFEVKKRDVLLQAESWIDEATNITDIKGFVCDNMQTVEYFVEIGTAEAVEGVYEEIVELIGGDAGENWSDCSEDEDCDDEEEGITKPKAKNSKNNIKNKSDDDSSNNSTEMAVPKKPKGKKLAANQVEEVKNMAVEVELKAEIKDIEE